MAVSAAGASEATTVENKITACPLAIFNVIDESAYAEFRAVGADAVIFELSSELKAVDGNGAEIASITETEEVATSHDAQLIYNVDDVATLNNLITYLGENDKKTAVATSSQAVAVTASGENRLRVFARAGNVVGKAAAADEIKAACIAGAQTIIIDGKTDYDTVRYIQSRLKAVWVTTSGGTEDIADAFSMGVYGVVTPSVKGYNKVVGLISSAAKNKEYILGRAPYNVAHRGLTVSHAENTVEAIRDAARAGADHVEIDIRLTKDKRIVLLHDDPVQYAMFNPDGTTASGRISQMTLAELKALDMKNGDKISTLDEVFSAANGEYEKDLTYLIEVKDENTTNELVELFAEKVKEYDMGDRIALITFHNGHFANLKRYLPEIPVSLLCYTDKGSTVEEKAFSFRSGIDMQYNGNGGMTSFYGDGTSRSAYAAAYKYLAKRGYALWLWTYDTSSMKEAMSRGVTGITTDDCTYLTGSVEKLVIEDEYAVTSLPKDGDKVKIDAVTYKGEIVKADAIVKVISSDKNSEKAILVYSPEDGFGLSGKTVTFVKKDEAEKGCGSKVNSTAAGISALSAAFAYMVVKRRRTAK